MTLNMEKMSSNAKDIDKAITSLREELEAVNYYNMRAEQATDPELKELLLHHRNEEVEHAAMLSEWLRRTMPSFDKEFKDYMFTEGSLIATEAGSGSTKSGNENVSLGIGSLKRK
ncbi:MAG: ferritin family protein [Cetobacterium sp.]